MVSALVEKYDLTERTAQFLDRQFVGLLIRFAQDKGDVTANAARDSLIKVLNGTLLVDQLAELGVAADKLAAKKLKVAELESAASEPSLAVAESLYSAGQYDKAIEMLKGIREAQPDTAAAKWGLYAAYVMNKNYDAAAELVPSLQELVDQRQGMDALVQLNSRTWLIHWMLFSLFQVENGLDKVCDTFFSSQYMSSIQAASPWILRYLAVATLNTYSARPRAAHSQRRLKDLVRALVQEQYEYTDPVLDLIVALQVNFEFAGLGQKIKDALQIIENDYILQNQAQDFAASVRFLITDLYFKVHDSVTVGALAETLALPESATAKLVDALIADNKLDATVSESNSSLYNVTHSKVSVISQVKDRIRALDSRSKQALSQAKIKNESQLAI